jgi:NTP pyrophosphatase (non-canonical NTP hydrolase)
MNNNIKAGADIHAGDGGYSLGTKEKYDEFVKGRNKSLGKIKGVEKMNDDTKEILTILQEECAEVIVEVSKCFRFGPDQMMEGIDVTNMQRLQKELGDLQAMIELLIDNKVGVTMQGLKEAKKAKFEKLKQWSNLKINK